MGEKTQDFDGGETGMDRKTPDGREEAGMRGKMPGDRGETDMDRKTPDGSGMAADMHCDTISKLYKMRQQGEAASLRENGGHLDLQKMKEGGYLLQNFALFVEQKQCEDPWQQVQALLALYREELKANEDLIAPVLTFGDIRKNRAEGRMCALLTVEEGGVCNGEVAKLHTLYDQGVRMMTLTWNYPNELGYPNLDKRKRRQSMDYLNTPDAEHGLTETGVAFVEEMERMGMIVDVSHLSDAGFFDVLAHTKKPFAASHSNARSVCPCARNLTDGMIRALAERGGVMGLNYCADFLTQVPIGRENPGTVEAVVRHARHIVDTGGIECLGLGSDFDGIDTHAELPGADKLGRLWDALHGAGFSQRKLDMIFSGNVLRLYREVL